MRIATKVEFLSIYKMFGCIPAKYLPLGYTEQEVLTLIEAKKPFGLTRDEIVARVEGWASSQDTYKLTLQAEVPDNPIVSRLVEPDDNIRFAPVMTTFRVTLRRAALNTPWHVEHITGFDD